ncbi:hypothetical protein Tco_0404819 [Tanacetum coccineum]
MAIAKLKISDIKGIDPSFYTHKILMEDDFKPAVQHQRRVNPKIHEVIKKEVIKFLDVGLIYPISDSPEGSPVQYQDAKPRSLQWILLLQEFDVIIRDKKGAENLAADHLSRLENPHQGDLEKKEINETFPLETLGMITFHGDSSTPCTISEKESDEVIKSSVEDLVPIPIYEKNYVTFSNPLFNSSDDFTSSDDKSLSDEDVLEDNVKIYSNLLFEFDDEYISSDVNSLFDEVLENIKSKDSYVSNFDELALLVTPLSDDNEDECFDPGGDVDEIEFLLHHDPSTLKISVASILEGFTDEPPLEENDDLFDLESKENGWKKILFDASIDDLMTEDKVRIAGGSGLDRNRLETGLDCRSRIIISVALRGATQLEDQMTIELAY